MPLDCDDVFLYNSVCFYVLTTYAVMLAKYSTYENKRIHLCCDAAGEVRIVVCICIPVVSVRFALMWARQPTYAQLIHFYCDAAGQSLDQVLRNAAG